MSEGITVLGQPAARARTREAELVDLGVKAALDVVANAIGDAAAGMHGAGLGTAIAADLRACESSWSSDPGAVLLRTVRRELESGATRDHLVKVAADRAATS